jgi:type I restriction enzyme, S subunit
MVDRSLSRSRQPADSGAIATKRKLIKVLEDQKQAIIQRAVTIGLDRNVRLKPSGVEWLGEMPVHWEVRRGKYYFHEVDQRSADGAEELMSRSASRAT